MKCAPFSPAGLDRMRESMYRHVSSGHLPGYVTLVSRDGGVHVDVQGVHEHGGSQPMQRDSIFRIASLTKPITAVAAMVLVEECRLRLDDPVDPWLPELSDRRVLKQLDGPLHDTVPAHRSITLRDLLTMRMGMGHILTPCEDWSIRRALTEMGLLLGPPRPQSLPAMDEWMRKVASLPLMHQPGEKWLYDIGFDVLGVLIARASGQAFEAFLRERIFDPLGMKDTAFHVPLENRHRLTACYEGTEIFDPVQGSEWAEPPAFAMGSGGLVSTADDYHAFCQMLLHKGQYQGTRILSRPSVALMTSDQLTGAQREENEMFFGESLSWGFGMSVCIQRRELFASPGRFGWDGGLGTSAYTDPVEGLVGILLTQRLMDSPQPPAFFADFWNSAYQAIQD